MSRAVKVWASDENRPSGDKLSNLTTAPKNWFREEPAYVAELYGLERGLIAQMYGVPLAGLNEFHVFVEDDLGGTHEFGVKVQHELVARVTPKQRTG